MQVMTGYDWTKNQGLDKIKVNNKLVAFFPHFLLLLLLPLLLLIPIDFPKAYVGQKKRKSQMWKAISRVDFLVQGHRAPAALYVCWGWEPSWDKTRHTSIKYNSCSSSQFHYYSALTQQNANVIYSVVLGCRCPQLITFVLKRRTRQNVFKASEHLKKKKTNPFVFPPEFLTSLCFWSSHWSCQSKKTWGSTAF